MKEKVVLCFDSDEAGQKAFMALRRFFINHYSTVRAEALPEGV